MTVAYNDIFFEVSSEPVKVKGKRVDGWQAIVRKDTGDVLSVQPDTYQLVTNDQVFPKIETALDEAEIQTNKLKRKPYISYGGRQTVVEYEFPLEGREVKKGDLVSLSLRVVNSYDGSLPVDIRVGGNRLVCENGMVVLDAINKARRRHTQNIDVSSLIGQMNASLESWGREVKKWSHWAKIPVQDEKAVEIFRTLPQANDKLEQELVANWEGNKEETGANVWSLYNALTEWSTHSPIKRTSEENYKTVQMSREERVRKALQSSTFKELVAT